MAKKTKFKKSYKKKIKKPFYKKKFFWFSQLFLFITLFIGCFILFFDFWSIDEIEFTKPGSLLEREITSLVEEKMNKKIIFFKSSSIFLFNTQKESSEILNIFPEIKKVEIIKKLPNTIKIDITKRIPIAFWCKDLISDCFLIDEEGFIFLDKNNTNHGLVKILKETNNNYNSGNVISKEKINFLYTIFSQSENLKIIILEISDNNVFAKTDKGLVLKFSFKENLKKQVKKLNIFINSITDKELKGIEYIDFRFGDKVYSK
jgi:cell division septal protein FtsQ